MCRIVPVELSHGRNPCAPVIAYFDRLSDGRCIKIEGYRRISNNDFACIPCYYYSVNDKEKYELVDDHLLVYGDRFHANPCSICGEVIKTVSGLLDCSPCRVYHSEFSASIRTLGRTLDDYVDPVIIKIE